MLSTLLMQSSKIPCLDHKLLMHHLCPGRSVERIKSEVAEKGDLGLVAESSRSNQRTMFSLPSLTVPGVYDKLKDIAGLKGSAVRMIR